MSEYTFKLLDLGEGTVEAKIAQWMVKVGDVVKEEDPVCSMLTDKADRGTGYHRRLLIVEDFDVTAMLLRAVLEAGKAPGPIVCIKMIA